MRSLPIHCNILWETPEAAHSAPRGDIVLTYCLTCGHIFNTQFNPERLAYGEIYDNTQIFSPAFRQYLQDLSAQLTARYHLHDKLILEIGSGRGDFLRLLVDAGDNRGVGFDPSYQPSPETTHPRISYIRDYYSAQYGSITPDFIVMRHVLEHLANPHGFVYGLREMQGERAITLYAEVPNADNMLNTANCWDVIYEHYGYFTKLSLHTLFERAGFDARMLQPRFDNQFLSVEPVPAVAPSPDFRLKKSQAVDDLLGAIRGFTEVASRQIDDWREQLREYHREGKRVVLWGAGSKGVSFCNMLQLTDEISGLVDINPRKQGKYIAGTAHAVLSADALQQTAPDVVLVMNKVYVNEIRAHITASGLQAAVVSI